MSLIPSMNGTAAAPAAPAVADEFAPAELHDRVVIMLLFDQVVTEDDVRAAWTKRAASGDPQRALWRVLASVEGVDSDLVFAEAARVYGFKSLRPNTSTARRHMKQLREQIDLRHWLALLSAGVVPAERKKDRLVFVTHDPTRPAVRQAVQQAWAGPHDLCYTEQETVVRLIRTATRHQEAYVRPSERFAAPWAAEAALEADPASTNGAANGELDRPTFMRLLEEALVELVRKDARAVCLVPNANDETELFLEDEGRLQPWYTEQKVSAQVLLAALKSYILEVQDERPKTRTRTIQRWIDGVRVTFAMDWLAEPNRLPCACIRVMAS